MRSTASASAGALQPRNSRLIGTAIAPYYTKYQQLRCASFNRVAAGSSGKYSLHDLPRHVSQPELATQIEIGQLLMIDAHEVKHRRVQVVDVNRILLRVV